MKTYTGDRTIDGVDVRVNDHPLPERTDVQNFTSTGFEWTYEGPGPKQLALALLVDHLNDEARAKELVDRFMIEIVANLANEWVLTSEDIESAVQDLSRA